MTVLIVHYHLRPGGVTRVIESQVKVLRDQGHEVVVASSGPAVDWGCQNLLIPELDYQKEGQIPLAQLLEVPADLWIIHNPTLGLNVAYPDLIEAAARSGKKILMQIHDFVEDGRPENYQLLGDRENIYPLAPHIHYATVNRRDLETLKKAGIPEARCHFLPNAINPPTLSGSFPEEQLLFYPVRGIRRKNLGELCLLAAHAPEGTRFAIALRAGSEEPQFLHDDWESLAKEQNLPIEFDVVGRNPGSFKDWLERSSHFVTTSITEGFGLTFLDPAFLKKPLIGRDLPEITKDFTPYGTLYQSIPIPLKNLPDLQECFFEELQRTMSAYGSPLTQDQLKSAWLNFSKNDEVDFGNLPEKLQVHVIKNVPLPWLRDWLATALKNPAAEIDTSPWTLATYSRTLATVVSKIEKVGPLTWLPREALLEQFLKPQRFHFLRSRLKEG